MMTMKEMRFCIKVVVTGKGNLKKHGQPLMARPGTSANVEAYLYVPASVCKNCFSRSRVGRKPEGGRWKVEGGRWKVEGGRGKAYMKEQTY